VKPVRLRPYDPPSSNRTDPDLLTTSAKRSSDHAFFADDWQEERDTPEPTIRLMPGVDHERESVGPPLEE